MNELFENISKLSIEELENLITRAQELIQEKQQEAQRQAELEKKRLEQERLEAERKKQEEIAELQRRLKELQGENTASKVQEYSMVSCPHCHELVPSGSRFCFYCGSRITQKKESKTDAFSSASASARPEQTFTHCPGCGASVPSGSQFCQDCGKPVGNANQNTKPQ